MLPPKELEYLTKLSDEEAEAELKAGDEDRRRADEASLRTMRLDQGCVHIWWCDLSAMPQAYSQEVLSSKERSHVTRFRFERDRRRYVLAHKMLRTLLGGYLGAPPVSIEILAEAHGKPFVEAARAIGMEFNTSRSHELAVYALCRGQRIGVDAEHLRGDPDLIASIAAAAFSGPDQARLAAASRRRRTEMFYHIWTRKEAAAKADGAGLGADLAVVDQGCSCVTVKVPNGYVAHIATAEPVQAVSLFSLTSAGWLPS